MMFGAEKFQVAKEKNILGHVYKILKDYLRMAQFPLPSLRNDLSWSMNHGDKLQ